MWTLILAGVSAFFGCYIQFIQDKPLWWGIPLGLLILALPSHIKDIIDGNSIIKSWHMSALWIVLWAAFSYYKATDSHLYIQICIALTIAWFVPALLKNIESTNKKFTGAGVIFIRDGKVLTVFRNNTQKNNNKHGLIGGRNQANETAKACAIREVGEEIGIELKPEDLRLVHVIHSIENSEETLGFYFLVESWEGEPYNKASDKHERIEWLDLNNLPNTMIARNRQALEHFQKNSAYSEHGWK